MSEERGLNFETYEILSRRLLALENECFKRGKIIARDILKWSAYPSPWNGVQLIYAPPETTVEQLNKAHKLDIFINRAIAEMKVEENS